MAENNAPLAWEVEDGDGRHGVLNPATWTEVGEAILALYGADNVTRMILENNDDGTGLVEWDFSDAGQLGDWLMDGVSWVTCAWHVPTEVFESEDEDAWRDAFDAGRFIRRVHWDDEAPEGYTRIVWVDL